MAHGVLSPCGPCCAVHAVKLRCSKHAVGQNACKNDVTYHSNMSKRAQMRYQRTTGGFSNLLPCGVVGASHKCGEAGGEECRGGGADEVLAEVSLAGARMVARISSRSTNVLSKTFPAHASSSSQRCSSI